MKELESSRAEACKSKEGFVLSGASLEPVVAAVEKFLDNPPEQLKGLIPAQVHELVARARQVIMTTTLDLCNDKQAQSTLRNVELVAQRDLEAVGRIYQPYCNQYEKFIKSEHGKTLLADLKRTLRDVVDTESKPVA